MDPNGNSFGIPNNANRQDQQRQSPPINGIPYQVS